jgi:hypothetical protein
MISWNENFSIIYDPCLLTYRGISTKWSKYSIR